MSWRVKIASGDGRCRQRIATSCIGHSVTPNQRSALLEFAAGRTYPTKVLGAFGCGFAYTSADTARVVLTILEEAYELEDAEAVAGGVYLGYAADFQPQHGAILAKLIEAPWHVMHEDIARALQQLRSPEAVEGLERTAYSHFEYLEYDNGYPLIHKCTWALADIGTPEAKQALERIAQHDDPEIAGYAQKRLAQWEQELHRKGKRSSP
jgi:hypothetical protein